MIKQSAIAAGSFNESVVYNVPGQARDIADIIKQLLQLKPQPGAMKTTLFTQLEFITKDNMQPGTCWKLPGQQ